MRLGMFDAIVLGNLCYGLELFCGSKADLARVQPAINAGLRTIFGVHPSTAAGPLLVESGIGPLAAISFGVTMCLFNRAYEKRTPIKLICHNPQAHNPCRPHKWDDLRKLVLARTLATSSCNDSADRYAAAGFIHTADFVHDPMFDQPRSLGKMPSAALALSRAATTRGSSAPRDG